MRTPQEKPNPCFCKYCNRNVWLEDWSKSIRNGRVVYRERCKSCLNAYQRERLASPEAKVRLQEQYRKRKAAGLVKALSWQQRTPEQKARAVDAVRAWRKRNQFTDIPLQNAHRSLSRHPSNAIMRRFLADTYGAACLCCKSAPGVCLDHVQPLTIESLRADPTANDWPNLQPLCRRCNTQKRLMATDYRPDHGEAIKAHLAAHPELSIQSLALYRRPKVTRIALGRLY